MNELTKVDPKEFGLEESKATELTQGLTVILEEREVLKKAYIETIELEITEENIPVFKELRLKIRDNRTKGIEPWHKVNKAFFWNGGKFIDSIKNKEILENEQMEAKLMEAEKHFENLEKERIAKLEDERVELCRPFVECESMILPDLGSMPTSLWDNYIVGLKASYDARIAAEKKADEERKEAEKLQALKVERESILRPYWNFLPENHPAFEGLSESEWSDFLSEMKSSKDSYDKEQEKIRKENERLQKEAEEKEAKRQEEIKAQQAKEEKERKEREEKERKLQAEKEEAEQKLRDKEAAELKAKEEEAAKVQAELNKGDSDKVHDLIIDLKDLKSKYSFKSTKNKKMYNDVCSLIDKIISHIE